MNFRSTLSIRAISLHAIGPMNNSALDQETERRLIDSLKSLQGSLTMIIVAHRHFTIRRFFSSY